MMRDYIAPGLREFWVHLNAFYEPSGAWYWDTELLALIPGGPRSGWTVRYDQPAEPVAREVLDAVSRYGLPAILAATDSPGFPPDQATAWVRTFPPVPSKAARYAVRTDLGSLAWVLEPTGQPADTFFGNLADAEPRRRHVAVEEIVEKASGDPRARPSLLDRLERDPAPLVRRSAAAGLIPATADAGVRAALAAAATEDEDLQVRWLARYALRLALRR
jgi:hypothetical protein